MPHRLRKPVITIGRDPRCDITVDASLERVSRQHAQIRRQGGYFVLYDASTYGTSVNGMPIKQHTLRDGDRIALADQATFTFWKEALYAASEQPQAPAPTGIEPRPARVINAEPQLVYVVNAEPQPVYVVNAGAPRHSTWGTGTMIGLIIATMLIPLVGFIAGIIGLAQKGKGGQSVALILWAIVCTVITYVVMTGGFF